MKTRTLQERKEFIESLTKRQKETLDHDLKEIEEFLKEEFLPRNFHSLAILRSRHDLNRVIKFGVHVPEQFVIDPDPQYQSYLKSNAEAATRLATLVRDFVEHGKTRSQLGTMEARLEVH